jgi:hypothetical protein
MAQSIRQAAISSRKKRRAGTKGATRSRAVHEKARTPSAEGPVTTTLRLRPEIRQGLEFLQRKFGGTMNKLMNDGLAAYVGMRTRALDEQLRASLEEIKRLRRRDPMFTRDFAEIAHAEAMYRAEDPVEGVPVRTDVGSAVSMVREVIGAAR